MDNMNIKINENISENILNMKLADMFCKHVIRKNHDGIQLKAGKLYTESVKLGYNVCEWGVHSGHPSDISFHISKITKMEKDNYNHAVRILEEAIDELFKGKLTTDKENHSGEGIFFSSKLMDRFLVYSDKKVFTHDNHNEIIGDINDNAKLYELFEGKGTVVFMQLENKTHKQLSEIFDMYADVDGGLTRTKIPMKNVFGNAFPVSRSQARRLCNRFDEFKEVILDFSGVDEMGQGFADELFSKYVERNPDIKITVLNENDKIAHMIAHVQKIK